MRRVILKTSVFFFILVAFNRIFWIWLPEGWENVGYYNKQRIFFEHYAHETNTLLFGSSRTFAQLDPLLFDSLNATHGLETRSYMLASSAVFYNEMFTHMEELFEDPRAPGNLKYLIVELSNIVTLYKNNLLTPRQSYYITPRSIPNLLQQLSAEDLKPLTKIVNAGYYLASLIADLSHLGYGNAKLQMLTHSETPSDSVWIHGKGHFSLSVRHPLHQRGVYRDRHNELMADTSVIADAFHRIDSINNTSSTQRFNSLVYQKYLDLITRFEARGVHVVIMLPLNREIDGELMSLYNALPDDHKINLCTIASNIPQLRHVDHWFDTGHINADGVVLLTSAFSDAFIGRIPSRNTLTE